jgi:hypothetical protein
MRVFVSSLITEFEEFRNSAFGAISSLGHEVIRAEDFSAGPTSPRIACLDGVRAADAVIVLLGSRYGHVQDSGLSATHEEFDEAKRNKPLFVFIQAGVKPEQRQAALISEAQNWSAGNFTSKFTDQDNLKEIITQSLHRWELSLATGQVDSSELKARALALLPADDRRYGSSKTSLAISIVGGPHQAILRPTELEDADFQRKLAKEALFGDQNIFNTSEGTETSIEGSSLTLTQESGHISLAEDGSLLIVLTLPGSRGMMHAIIEEDVTAMLLRCLGFSEELLRTVDPTERLSSIVIATALLNVQYGPWRTRKEQKKNPDSGTMSRMFNDDAIQVTLTPPVRSRASLRQQLKIIAEDLTVLLRRHFRQ